MYCETELRSEFRNVLSCPNLGMDAIITVHWRKLNIEFKLLIQKVFRDKVDDVSIIKTPLRYVEKRRLVNIDCGVTFHYSLGMNASYKETYDVHLAHR